MDETYAIKVLRSLDTLPIDQWYPFKSNNHAADKLMEVIKLRIDLSGDYLISNDYTHFKRIELPEKVPKSVEMTYKIEWKPNSYELNEFERNLPDFAPKKLTKEQDKAYQARRTDK